VTTGWWLGGCHRMLKADTAMTTSLLANPSRGGLLKKFRTFYGLNFFQNGKLVSIDFLQRFLFIYQQHIIFVTRTK